MDSNQYGEAFEFEVTAWCYALKHYPGEIYRALIHRFIKEVSPIFFESICNSYAFDTIKIAQQICKASKYLIAEVEVVYSMIARIPGPSFYETEDQLYTLAAVLDKVEQKYPGAIARMEQRWAFQLKEENKRHKEEAEREKHFQDPFAKSAPANGAAHARQSGTRNGAARVSS